MAVMPSNGLAEPYSLSGTPLILDEGEWVDWMPPIDHPSHGRFRELELNFIGPEYTAQKQLLDAAYERGGIAIFVASFSVAQRQGGSRVSYSVWGEGVDTLLPVTQKVAFLREGEGLVALGEWERVFEIIGDLMEMTEDYPRRYRVREFPDKALLDAIGLGEM
jgi:hypothetical protein